jgi:hypothetical protein
MLEKQPLNMQQDSQLQKSISDEKMIRDYLDKHPNSELSRKEILDTLNKK